MPFGKTRERKRRAQSSSVTATRKSSASETFPRPKQVCFYHLMKRNVKGKKKKSHSAWLRGHSLISTGLVWHHGNHLRQRRGVNLRWWQITFPFLIFENRNRLINFKINICGKCSFTDWTRCSCGGCWCLAKSAVGEHHHSHPMCCSDCFLYLSDMFPMSTWEGQPFWKGRKGAL